MKTPAASWKAVTGNWASGSGELVANGSGMFCVTDKWWRAATFSYRRRISGNGGDVQNWAGFQFRKTNPQDSHDQSRYVSLTSCSTVVACDSFTAKTADGKATP